MIVAIQNMRAYRWKPAVHAVKERMVQGQDALQGKRKWGIDGSKPVPTAEARGNADGDHAAAVVLLQVPNVQLG